MKKIYQTYCMCGRDTGLVGEQEGNERVEYTESSAAGECEDCARSGGDYAGTVATKKVVPFPSRPVAQDSLKKCKVLCACGEQMCAVGVQDGEDLSTIPVSLAIGLCLGCQGRGGVFGFAVVVQKAEREQSQAPAPEDADQEEEVGRGPRTARDRFQEDDRDKRKGRKGGKVYDLTQTGPVAPQEKGRWNSRTRRV